jgi:hypothetical protein
METKAVFLPMSQKVSYIEILKIIVVKLS